MEEKIHNRRILEVPIGRSSVIADNTTAIKVVVTLFNVFFLPIDGRIK